MYPTPLGSDPGILTAWRGWAHCSRLLPWARCSALCCWRLPWPATTGTSWRWRTPATTAATGSSPPTRGSGASAKVPAVPPPYDPSPQTQRAAPLPRAAPRRHPLPRLSALKGTYPFPPTLSLTVWLEEGSTPTVQGWEVKRRGPGWPQKGPKNFPEQASSTVPCPHPLGAGLVFQAMARHLAGGRTSRGDPAPCPSALLVRGGNEASGDAGVGVGRVGLGEARASLAPRGTQRCACHSSAGSLG